MQVKMTSSMDHQTVQNTCKWITKEFFNEILSKYLKETTVQVLEYQLSSPLKKGENYSSQIIRGLVKYSTGDKNKDASSLTLLIKSSLFNNDNVDTTEMDYFFELETFVYTEIIPEVEKLFEKAGDSVKIAPRFIAANLSPTYMIFEDLSADNFKNADRKVGLDFQHLKLCLTTLAKWHAGSAYLGTEEPQKFQKFHTPLLRKDDHAFNAFFTNTLSAVIDTASTWPGFEQIVKKLEQLLPNRLCEKIHETFVESNQFNTLTHGDAWVNNIMFKNDDDGKAIDINLVDFARVFWGSPGIDLTYLLFTSGSDSVRETEWDELLQHYHEVLAAALKAIGYTKSIPSLTDIHVEFLEKAMYAVGISLVLIGLRKIPNSEDATMESLMGNSNEDKVFRKNVTEVEGFRNTMEYLLNFYDRKGFLNH